MKEPIKFEVHYHGAPVLVGERYDIKNIHAHLIYSDKEFEDVRSFAVSKNLITHTGQNSFYAIYIWNGKAFVDYFMVYGYTNKRYVDKEFKIIEIQTNSHEEDVTEFCYPLFYDEILGKIYITLDRLNKNLYKGTFRVTLPKDTGMLHQYASEWLIEKDDFNVKTTLIKTYNDEEENEDG